MTALPVRGGGRVTTPRPRPAAPIPSDEAEALRHAVDVALAACQNVERQLRRDMDAAGVAATARRLGISRTTAQRFKAGGWPVTAALTKLRDTLRV